MKGLYAAASAMLANLARQNQIAHNVANMDTPGFKQVLSSLTDYLHAPVHQPHPEASASGGTDLVGSVGLGVQNRPESIDFSGGSLRYSGESLDLAIQGPGFFRVETPEGERYTRDGRFNLDLEGNLVTVDGFFVLDDNGQRIRLEGGSAPTVTGEGVLLQDGEEVARLGIAVFADPAAALTRSISNTFAAQGQPDGEEQGVVLQGYLESANVNAAQMMTQMVQVARSYEAAQQMVQTQDELNARAISRLGSW